MERVYKMTDFPVNLCFGVPHDRHHFAFLRDDFDRMDARMFCNRLAEILPCDWYVDYLKIDNLNLRMALFVCMRRPEDVTRFWLLAGSWIQTESLYLISEWSQDRSEK